MKARKKTTKKVPSGFTRLSENSYEYRGFTIRLVYYKGESSIFYEKFTSDQYVILDSRGYDIAGQTFPLSKTKQVIDDEFFY